MWTRYLFALLLLIGGWAVHSPPPVHASCEVQTSTPTYTNGQFVGADLCDANGNKKVTLGGAGGGGLGTATAAAPTIGEGVGTNFSFDLSGNARVTLGTLFSGEDQTNNLLMTSGGAVRLTTVASGMVVGGDATPTAAQIIPVGHKTIYGSVTGTGAVTQTQKIYGGITSGLTATTGILLCTLTLSGTTTAVDACPVITANFSFYMVVTSVTTGTGATGVVTAMY